MWVEDLQRCHVKRKKALESGVAPEEEFLGGADAASDPPEPSSLEPSSLVPSFELLWTETRQKHVIDPGPPWFEGFDRKNFDSSAVLQWDIAEIKHVYPHLLKKLRGQYCTRR